MVFSCLGCIGTRPGYCTLDFVTGALQRCIVNRVNRNGERRENADSEV